MDMHKLPYEATAEQKLESCLHCADNSLTMLGEYGLPTIDLRSLVTPSMRQRIEQALPRRPPIWVTSSSRGSRLANSA